MVTVVVESRGLEIHENRLIQSHPSDVGRVNGSSAPCMSGKGQQARASPSWRCVQCPAALPWPVILIRPCRLAVAPRCARGRDTGGNRGRAAAAPQDHATPPRSSTSTGSACTSARMHGSRRTSSSTRDDSGEKKIILARVALGLMVERAALCPVNHIAPGPNAATTGRAPRPTGVDLAELTRRIIHRRKSRASEAGLEASAAGGAVGDEPAPHRSHRLRESPSVPALPRDVHGTPSSSESIQEGAESSVAQNRRRANSDIRVRNGQVQSFGVLKQRVSATRTTRTRDAKTPPVLLPAPAPAPAVIVNPVAPPAAPPPPPPPPQPDALTECNGEGSCLCEVPMNAPLAAVPSQASRLVLG